MVGDARGGEGVLGTQYYYIKNKIVLNVLHVTLVQVRVYTKNNVLGSLGTESFRPSAAAQCIQLIAMAELPRQMWPNLLTTLVQVRTINLFSIMWVVQLYFTLSRM